MKTDIDIKDDIYNLLKKSALVKEVTGVLRRTKRPDNSVKEDIIISVLANQNGQIQEAFVNVNIYVSDLFRDNQYEENSPRLRKLCKMSEELLKVGRGNDYRFTLDSQRVLEVSGKNEHCINNKLLYKQYND